MPNTSATPAGNPGSAGSTGSRSTGGQNASTSGPATLGTDVGAAAPGSLDLAVCVPFRQVLAFEAERDRLATRSHTEQSAANQALQAATARMTALLKGAAPAAVTQAIADLGKDTIEVTPGPAPGGAAHPEADVLALRQYLADNCGGQPGTVAQESAIRAAVQAWLQLPGTVPAGTNGCIHAADIRVARVDPAYASVLLANSCPSPGGGGAVWHLTASGGWKLVEYDADPCGLVPNAVLADLFGPVPTCATGATGTPQVHAAPLQQSGANYRVGGSYPQLTGLSGGAAQGTINSVLQQAATGAAASFQRELAAAGGTLKVSYRTTYLPSPTHPYLSVQLLLLRSAAGAAHPSGSVESFTFHVRSGYRYHLADLFRSGADYRGYLAGEGRSELDARYGKGTWQAITSGGGANLFSAWNLTSTGLEVTFNGAPSVLATPSVVIPYSDPVLRSLARPNGALANP